MKPRVTANMWACRVWGYGSVTKHSLPILGISECPIPGPWYCILEFPVDSGEVSVEPSRSDRSVWYGLMWLQDSKLLVVAQASFVKEHGRMPASWRSIGIKRAEWVGPMIPLATKYPCFASLCSGPNNYPDIKWPSWVIDAFSIFFWCEFPWWSCWRSRLSIHVNN